MVFSKLTCIAVNEWYGEAHEISAAYATRGGGYESVGRMVVDEGQPWPLLRRQWMANKHITLVSVTVLSSTHAASPRSLYLPIAYRK
jgi:hypothetical protein